VEKAEQQVDAIITMTMSLPIEWDEDRISIHLRANLLAAFAGDLPDSIPDENGNPQSAVNFTFTEEAEIYGNKEYEPGEAPNRQFLVACPGLSNLLFVEEEDASDAAYAAAQECADLHSYGEASGVYKVFAVDPLGGAGRLLGSFNADENGDLID
jgi:hypothetical protein